MVVEDDVRMATATRSALRAAGVVADVTASGIDLSAGVRAPRCVYAPPGHGEEQSAVNRRLVQLRQASDKGNLAAAADHAARLAALVRTLGAS